MRKLCALPSKPSGRPSRSRASRSSTCSPRCPNGGWPRSWASAAASTTSGSQPPSFADRPGRRPAARRSPARPVPPAGCASAGCARAGPAPAGLTTCVTPASRAKNGDAAIRSRSTRNGLVARPTPYSATHDRRAGPRLVVHAAQAIRATSARALVTLGGAPPVITYPNVPRTAIMGRGTRVDTGGVTEVLVVGRRARGPGAGRGVRGAGAATTLVDPAPARPVARHVRRLARRAPCGPPRTRRRRQGRRDRPHRPCPRPHLRRARRARAARPPRRRLDRSGVRVLAGRVAGRAHDGPSGRWRACSPTAPGWPPT